MDSPPPPAELGTASDGSASECPIIIRRRAILAPLLVLVNVLWFAGGWYRARVSGVGADFLRGNGHPLAIRILIESGALTPSELERGHWWRLATSAFVHVGAFHLLANMLMLAVLGSVSERIWGRGRFAAIYLGSALAGAVAAMALHPRAGGGPALLAGASGALWGVLLSVVVWYVSFRKRLPAEMVREWRWKLGGAVILNSLISFVPGVSLEAHAGGGLAGAALALWLDRRPRPHRGASALGVVLASVALILGLLGAMRYAPAWKALREPAPAERESDPPPVPPEVPERDAVIAALAEFDGKLAPLRSVRLVERLKLADFILGKNTPKSVEEAQSLGKDAGAARERLRPFGGEFAKRYEEYARRVVELAEAITTWQTLPPRSPLDGIESKLAATLLAWKELNGQR